MCELSFLTQGGGNIMGRPKRPVRCNLSTYINYCENQPVNIYFKTIGKIRMNIFVCDYHNAEDELKTWNDAGRT